MIRGSVDTISSKVATGWIYSDSHKEPLSVEAVINDEIVGRAIANQPRPDLATAGFGDGKCAFEIRFKSDIDAMYLPFVQVRLAGTDLELRRWAGAGFRDFFRALHQRYPSAGRSASVFGGLWTDRTDASALLKGKTDIGSVTSHEANRLARFIQDGVLVLTRNSGQDAAVAGNKTNDRLTAAVAAAVFDEDILKMLRVMLEDQPVAVRADVVSLDEDDFLQMSVIEDLPSPAECLGIAFPFGESTIFVDVVRGGHRFPEFLPNGLSRWSHSASNTTGELLSPDLPIDRHQVSQGSVILIGGGALHRIRAAGGSAIRLLVLPARQSLLRFHQKTPIGELTHNSGARIWI